MEFNQPGSRRGNYEVYEATKEQFQSWKYHNNLPAGQQHQIILIDILLDELNQHAFEKSIEQITRRHESLRTFFRVVDGVVKQCVLAYDKTLFSTYYYNVSESSDAKVAIDEIINKCKNELSRLHIPPLFRCCVIKTAKKKHYIIFLIHHIMADAWSASVIYKEIGLFYQSITAGVPIDIVPMHFQLKDYALWQKNWLNDNLNKIQDYWISKLGKVEDRFIFNDIYSQYEKLSGKVLARAKFKDVVSTEEKYDILNSAKSACYFCHTNMALYSRLLELAASWRCSIWAIMNVSFRLLYFLFSKSEKMVIAMPVSGRNKPGLEALIGCLIGGIYLYQSLNEDIAVKSFVRTVYQEMLESHMNIIYDHGDINLNWDVIRLNCDLYVNLLDKEIIGDHELYLEKDKTHENYDTPEYYYLTCFVFQCKDGIYYNWRYNLTLFAPELIEFMAGKHAAILQLMCDDPDIAINKLISLAGNNCPS
jgi:hypothetical protein